MLAHLKWAFLVLSCVRNVAADTAYQFTMGVTNPAPVPGQPFTIIWSGGESDEAVYIVLNGYFPDTSNQNIIYVTTDILSNAPNNGSWTYNVPLNIDSGRHSFSIGDNPLQLSATTDIFTILSSQTSAVTGSPAPFSSNTVFQTYNGCGLPPLPDYTYTAYQPPCTTTVNGVVQTVYPIVPATDSASFYGGLQTLVAASTQSTTIPSSSDVSPTSPTPFNTAFAPGIFAQALQCPTSVTPSTTKLTASGATTIFSLVSCAPTSTPPNSGGGVCHTSGYTTFSISGTSSVCCPDGWATTDLNAEVFCFTATAGEVEKRGLGERQVSTETLAVSPNSLVEIMGLAFTTAGVVTVEVAAETGSGITSSTKGSSSSVVGTMGSVSSAIATKSASVRLDFRPWTLLEMMVTIVALCYFV